MVLLWVLRRGERLPRYSGLRFLRGLVTRPEFREPGATFWVMPSAADSDGNRAWLQANGVPVEPAACYLAPLYPPAGRLEDAELLARLEAARPRFVILGVRGGVQERLGFFLRSHLSYRPTLLCTGGAIALLSGRQTAIPVWADRLWLGWLLRLANSPRAFAPRLWKSLRLVRLLWKYGAGPVAG
jgi:hypothetical protein